MEFMDTYVVLGTDEKTESELCWSEFFLYTDFVAVGH